MIFQFVLEENGDEVQRVEVFRLYSEGASRRNIQQYVEENGDTAQVAMRVEVFRLYFKGVSRRNI